MFSQKKKSASTTVHVFHKLLEAAVQRGFAEKQYWKICKIHKKASFVESLFSPVKLLAWKPASL